MAESTAFEPPPRTGAVELADIALTQEPDLAGSADFQSIEGRLKQSEEIVNAIRARGDFPLGELLTQALETIVAQSGLDGMMIASEEGLAVAQSQAVGDSDILAAIGCLFDSTVRRAHAEALIESVEEMTLRGEAGEQIIVRYFPGMERRFVLVAYSRQPCAHRRATARALKQCGELLALAVHGPNPKRRARRAPKPVSVSQEELNTHGQSNQT